MDRRTFMSAGAISVVGAASACSQGADTESSTPASPAINRNQTVRLRMVTTWPKGFPGLGTAAERTAQYVRDMSGGAMEIEVFGAGEIVGAFEVFDAVSNGVADIYHAADYYWQGRSPAYNFFSAVPMGLTAYEMMAWIEFGGGQELWEELSNPFNIQPFMAGNSGHQMGGWFKREVNTLEDFRGLRMRIPGLGGAVIRELGGAAVALSGGEIYQSLQSGAIDATEWVGPWNDLAFGFYREAPYYYGPGFHEPGTALAVGMNLDTWNGLSSDMQAIFKSACRAVNHTSLAEYTHQNALALKTLTEEHGVQLRSFSDEIWNEIGRISEQVVADTASSDDLTRRVYDSYIDARNKGMAWSKVSEAPYYVQRARVLSE